MSPDVIYAVRYRNWLLHTIASQCGAILDLRTILNFNIAYHLIAYESAPFIVFGNDEKSALFTDILSRAEKGKLTKLQDKDFKHILQLLHEDTLKRLRIVSFEDIHVSFTKKGLISTLPSPGYDLLTEDEFQIRNNIFTKPKFQCYIK